MDPKFIERFVLRNLIFLAGLVSRSELTKGRYLGLKESFCFIDFVAAAWF